MSSHTAPMPSTWATAYVCCTTCQRFRLFCSCCGAEHTMQLQVVKPFPADFTFSCDHCEGSITVRLLGWRPNPTMELPAAEVLSDALPGLEKSWRKPAVSRTRPSLVVAGARPCPPEATRHRLSYWVAIGAVPFDLPPTSLSRGFRLAFPGQRPKRVKQTLIYSRREVALSLAAIGVMPPDAS